MNHKQRREVLESDFRGLAPKQRIIWQTSCLQFVFNSIRKKTSSQWDEDEERPPRATDVYQIISNYDSTGNIFYRKNDILIVSDEDESVPLTHFNEKWNHATFQNRLWRRTNVTNALPSVRNHTPLSENQYTSLIIVCMSNTNIYHGLDANPNRNIAELHHTLASFLSASSQLLEWRTLDGELCCCVIYTNVNAVRSLSHIVF